MSKLTLILDNKSVVIRGAIPSVIKKLESATSYLVAGHYFSPGFRKGFWDGREHTLVFKKGRYTAPIGLLGVIKEVLDEHGIKYQVKRKRTPPIERVKFDWNTDIVLRDYQQEAIEAFCSKPEVGRGILKMPIRSGKTKTAAGIIQRIGVRTLFLVPSTMLMHQTARALAEALPGADVGTIGDGTWAEGEHITVATIQTLARLRGGTKHQCPGNRLRNDSGVWIKGQYAARKAPCGRKQCDGSHKYTVKRDPKYGPLVQSYDFVVFDECHHLKGESWRAVMLDCPSRYRLGLSATVFFDSAKENETGVIWLRACCGAIKYEVSTSRLIDQGFLMRQHVELYAVRTPDLNGEKWSAGLRDQAIYLNEWRNRFIVLKTMEKLLAGRNVMIVSNRLAQIEALSDLCHLYKVEHVTITGSDPTHLRDERVYDFTEGNVHVIIGTVFGEGVDIPILEVLINAEGGQDMKSTIQRMRNMTPAEGKETAELIDFWDDTNAYFRKHSRARAATYESEPAFVVKKMWK